MKATTLANVGALLVALLAATAGALVGGPSEVTPAPAPAALTGLPDVRVLELAGGGRALVDASGVEVPLATYQRIVSASPVADEVLIELVEPGRIVAHTAYMQRFARIGFKLAGKAGIEAAEDVEGIVALGPDLVIVSSLYDTGRLARLREAGIRVYDLGDMRGVASLVPSILALGHLVGEPARAEAVARAFLDRIGRIAADVPADARAGALYVSVYGGELYGGAAGSGYHDVLVHAGLDDVAAAHGFRDWPRYTSEQLLAVAPEWIVTKPGMRAALCRYPGLDALSVCRIPGRIVEIDEPLLDATGLLLLDAAEAVHTAVYGPAAAPIR